MNAYVISQLESTRDNLINLLNSINDRQFIKTNNKNEWNVIQIVEHLCLIEEAYMREFLLCLHFPDNTTAMDLKLEKYEFPKKMKAKEAYEPIGRFSTKEIAIEVFSKDRQLFIDQVKNCDTDLKTKFTYRNQKVFQSLHDMIITNCEHTTRHTKQIEVLMTKKKNGT
jgi:uncharacterized damage-inducible protein DinB